MMISSIWRININIMEIVKILKDYSKTPLEKELSEYFTQKLDSVVCCEKIKNTKFMLQYIKPVHDFVIYTTSLTGSGVTRML